MTSDGGGDGGGGGVFVSKPRGPKKTELLHTQLYDKYSMPGLIIINTAILMSF